MKFNWTKIVPDILAVVFFLLLSWAYFYTPISEGLTLGGHDTAASVGQGREQVQFHQETGEYTRWTNTLFSGMPTYQIAPSYESDSLLRGAESIYGLFTPEPLSYLFLYLIGFYLLLRAFRLKPWMAVAGALAWAFSSYFLIIISAGHIWKVMTLCFIPPTIAGLVWCYRGKYLLGGIVTALFAAMQIGANHIQMSYYFFFLMLFAAIAWGIYAVAHKPTAEEAAANPHPVRRWLMATATLLVAGVLAIVINLPNLYHTYQYSQQSMRGPAELSAIKGAEANQTDGGLDRSYITAWSYGIDETATLLIPDFKGGGSGSIMERDDVTELPGYDDFYGCAMSTQQALGPAASQATPPGLNQYWGEQPFTVGPVYVGAFVCFLFLLGLFIVKGPWKWALLGATILSLLFAWGHNDAWFTNFCIDHLPLYNKFRTPSSALVIAEFCMPLLGLLALAEFAKRPSILWQTKRGQIGVSAALLLTLVPCLLYYLFPELAGSCISSNDTEILDIIRKGSSDEFADVYTSAISSMHHAILSASALRSALVIGAGLVLMAIYAHVVRKQEKPSTSMGVVLGIGVALLMLVDLWPICKRYLNDNSFAAPEAVLSIQPTEADTKVLSDSIDGRVLDVSRGNPFNETANHTPYFHQSVGGYNAAKLHRYQDLIDRALADELPQLVGHINEANGDMTQVPLDTIAPMFCMLNTRWIILGPRQIQAVQNPYANGNGWFVGELLWADTPDAEMEILLHTNTKTTAVADKRFSHLLDGTPLDTAGTISLTERKANSVSYDVHSEKGGLAVFSEIYYPGWMATIDGESVEPGRVDYVLRALPVPAGNHQVVFTYEPASVDKTQWAAYAAYLLLLLATAWGIWRYVRRRKPARG